MSAAAIISPPPGGRKCGFVAVLGAPNAGKSTLVNAMVGAKVSIVSHKTQTTRSRIRGVARVGNTQVVFIDTPGVFTAPWWPVKLAIFTSASLCAALFVLRAVRGSAVHMDRA